MVPAMIFDVSHRTLYRYSEPVVHSQHLVHMTPREVPWQSVRHHSLIVEPAPTSRSELVDAFGNTAVLLEIEVPHDELVVHARSTIETSARRLPALEASTPWDGLHTDPDRPLDVEVVQLTCASRLTMPTLDIADYAHLSFPPGRPVLAGTLDLTRRIFTDFKFDATATDVSTPLTQVFQKRRGVCQDFAHLMLACLRALRIPARYVSGYLLTRPPPGQVKMQGADASHAWVSVWAPETGWVDFDPTNNMVAGDEHIAFAFGRDYDDISPISGILLGGAEHTVSVAVDVTQVE
jgi:transglutaminase-like putative cysteine protease